MMNTVNSDQEVAVGNIVTNFLVPVVLIRSRLAGMCYDAIHMTATEVKPKRTFFSEKRKNIYVSSRVSQDLYDLSDY